MSDYRRRVVVDAIYLESVFLALEVAMGRRAAEPVDVRYAARCLPLCRASIVPHETGGDRPETVVVDEGHFNALYDEIHRLLEIEHRHPGLPSPGLAALKRRASKLRASVVPRETGDDRPETGVEG